MAQIIKILLPMTKIPEGTYGVIKSDIYRQKQKKSFINLSKKVGTQR